MNHKHPSTGFNRNQWQILLDLENSSYFLLDNMEDQEIISWLKCQEEWQAIAQSQNVTIFQRKTINLNIPAV